MTEDVHERHSDYYAKVDKSFTHSLDTGAHTHTHTHKHTHTHILKNVTYHVYVCMPV